MDLIKLCAYIYLCNKKSADCLYAGHCSGPKKRSSEHSKVLVFVVTSPAWEDSKQACAKCQDVIDDMQKDKGDGG